MKIAVSEAAEPVADAGIPQTIEKNELHGGDVVLDGSNSFDPDGDAIDFQWFGPFTTTTGLSPSVHVPEGRYLVSLITDDNALQSVADSVTIDVLPCFDVDARPKAGKVQLTWTNQEGVSLYEIYRSPEVDPGAFVKIGETQSDFSTYLDEIVVNETTYLYIVGAFEQDTGTTCYSGVISSHPTAVRSRSPINYNPVIYSGPVLNGTEDIVYNYDVNATDPNGNPLSYILTRNPGGMSIDESTGLITWTPASAGVFDVTVEVNDGLGGKHTQAFTISVETIPPLVINVTVPDVIGMPQAEAESTIAGANLSIGVIITSNSGTVPVGNVISQNPSAGTSVSEGSVVDIDVSLGPATVIVTVPDVIGVSQEAAESTIVSANLTVGAITTSSSDTVAAGNVISQTPLAGTSVPEGTAVDIQVSIGPILVLVPDVSGFPQSNAESAIVSVNLTVGTITTLNSDAILAGSVISQNPSAGTLVPEGSAVDLELSIGPATIFVTVPDVSGFLQSNAESTIVSINLSVGAITTSNSDSVIAGNVISQTPLAGTSVPEGTVVDLQISLGPVTVLVPNVLGFAQGSAESAIVSANLSVGTITTSNSGTVPVGNVISQNPPAGTSVFEGTAVDMQISLGPVMVTVPDVTGIPQADAESAITTENLVVRNVTTSNSDVVQAGNVISQNPVAGSVVPEASSVDIEVSIGPPNVPPVAVDDSYGLEKGNTLTIAAADGLLSNDNDPEGDPLTPVVIRDVSNGTLALSPDGSFTYTPAVSLNQVDAFSYVVNDGFSDSNIATVLIDATGVDIKFVSVNTSGMTTNSQTLEVSGTVAVKIRNQGSRPFNGDIGTLLFEDRNGNGIFDSNVDNVIGAQSFSGNIGSNSMTTVDVPVSGKLLFLDNLIYAHSSDIIHSGQDCVFQLSEELFHPVVKWSWDAVNSSGVAHSPIVTPLIDTNGDGLINERDVPAVIIATSGNPIAGLANDLVALRGDTGEMIFSVPSPANRRGWRTNGHTPAVGDIDDDGRPEIVITGTDGDIFAFNNTGILKWTRNASEGGFSGNVSLVDLDADGKSEILATGADGKGMAIYNYDGTTRVEIPELPCSNCILHRPGEGGALQAVDLNLDGIPEIVGQASAADRDGNFLWSWQSFGLIGSPFDIHGVLDGGATEIEFENDNPLVEGFTWPVIANLDDDPNPEVIITSSGSNFVYHSMWIFDHDGQLNNGPFTLFQEDSEMTYFLGPPTVADFDGDGKREIAHMINKNRGNVNTFNDPTRTMVSLHNPDGTLIWQKDLTRGNSFGHSANPLATFDFDGNGTLELVCHDHQKLYILNGADGTTLFEMAIPNFQTGFVFSSPTIADVDADGNAEIIVPYYDDSPVPAGSSPKGGVLVLGNVTGNWIHSRGVWNQFQYKVTNVNDDGTIPVRARNSWDVNNSHREQVPIEGLDPFAAADLTVSKITLRSGGCSDGATNIGARIGNGGNLQAGSGVLVNFYNGDPDNGGDLMGSSETTMPLFPGEFEDVTIECVDSAPDQVFVTINETPVKEQLQSANLSLLPHSWAQTSGMSSSSTIIKDSFGGFRGIDGESFTNWREAPFNNNIDPSDSFYEVWFPFPVSVTTVTVENNIGSINAGFLAGTVTLSNGFSIPMTLDANGEGSVSFSEQTDITWVRLTATSVISDEASLSEFIVGGSYIEPGFAINDCQSHINNIAACGVGLSPCEQGVNRSPQIVSNPPVTALVDSQYVYNIDASDPDNDTLSYAVITSSAGLAIDEATGVLTWTPDSTQVGDHNVTVVADDGRGLSDTQNFTIHVAEGTIVPDVVGFPQAQAETSIVASDLTVGVITEDSSDTVPVGRVIMQNPAADVEVARTTPVDLIISLGAAPVSNAGPDQTVGEGVLVTLDGSGSFDADGDAISFKWTQTSGSEIGGGIVTLSDSTVAQPTFISPIVPVQLLPFGELEFVISFDLEVTAGGLTHTDSVDIRVIDDINNPPVADAGHDRFARVGRNVDLDGSKSSDPDGDTLTTNWTFVSKPAGSNVTILNLTGILTGRFTPDLAGEYIAELIVNDGENDSVPDQVTISVANDSVLPTVSISVNPFVADVNQEVTITVNASDDQAVAVSELTINDTVVDLDQNGIATFSSNKPGSFLAKAIITDFGGNQAMTSRTFQVFATPPVVEIKTPEDGDRVTNITDVIGTVDDGDLVSYTLEYATLEGGFVEIATGTSPVIDDVLGSFDPTLLQNDTYRLRLSAVDSAGSRSTIEQQINVTGELKLGNFRLSFIDLSIPVSGVPITISRTYDTLDANQQGDFGFGWKMDIVNSDLRTSVPKTGLEESALIFSPFIAGTGPTGKGGTRVYVTTPGGKREGFTFVPKLAPGLRGSFLRIFEPEFIPDPGVKSRLSVQKIDLQVLEDEEHFGQAYPFSISSIPYNPSNPAMGAGLYTLVTPDGLNYTIRGLTGKIVNVSDPNGNKLTFTNNGVLSSTGKEVLFEKDNSGRVTAVIDPMGNRISYEYDGLGDLVAVTDREGNVTQFNYRTDFPHYLDEVIDPLGRTGARIEYDEHGRLTGIRDADGNLIAFEHNLDSNTEIVRDALGNPTTFVYDDRGNVTKQIDAIGGVAERTYDDDNNMLSETDQLGNTTTFTYDERSNVLSEADPLGNTTTFTYTTIKPGGLSFKALFYSKLSENIDPLGNTSVNTYDRFGNTISFSDNLGNITEIGYDSDKNPTTITDPQGNKITMVYDSFGRMIEQIDSVGRETMMTYDDNGNLLSQSTKKLTESGVVTLTTSMSYDKNRRVLSITDAEGNLEGFEYDKAGNRTAIIDALGRNTEFRYNGNNLLTETIYPDNTPGDLADNPRLKSGYDARGQKIAEIDELGRNTKFFYDKVGRLVQTEFPDDTPLDRSDNPNKRTEYDAAGRVVAEINEQGHRTGFEYDNAGQLVLFRDAIGNESGFVYDAADRVVEEIDALGRITQIIYNARGQSINNIFTDGTNISRQFDENGYLVTETNQTGNSTMFEYAKDGRLIAVINPLGSRFDYAYDEQENLITQQDTNGNVTKFEYDDLGHRTATILPLGQLSTSVYDAVGNLASVTDFNGDTIAFDYDDRNRLIAKILPDGTSVNFTYTPTGKLETETDSRGKTQYEYDARDRLVKVVNPDGTSISYTYDIASNRTSLALPSGTTNYTYDAVNRINSVTGPDNGLTNYFYDAVGNLIRTELPNTTVEKRQYDDNNRLIILDHNNSLGEVFSSYTYSLDAVGNRISVEEDDGRLVEYAYDEINRLISEDIFEPGSIVPHRTIEYTFDGVGNRLAIDDSVNGITNYEYDSNDRLLIETSAGQETNYTYDENGNTLSRNEIGGENVAFSWDVENRLVAADTDGDSIPNVQNMYNSNGIRVVQIIEGNETRFLIDSNRLLAQVLEEYTADSSINVSYVHGLDLIAQDRDSITSYYHVDGLGSTRDLTDSNGIITNSYVYDAFGVISSQIGSTENIYLFAGEQRDAAVGLDYLRARYLDINSGRFYGTDPFGGLLRSPTSLHRYLYANGNPVNFVDPSGKFSLAELTISQGLSKALSTIAIPLFTTTAVTTSVIIKMWGPAFAARYGAIAILAETSDHKVTQNAFNVFNEANKLISRGAVLIDFGQKISNLGFAVAGLAQSIVELPATVATGKVVSLASEITQIGLDANDIKGSINKIKGSNFKNPGASKREAFKLEDFIIRFNHSALKILGKLQ